MTDFASDEAPATPRDRQRAARLSGAPRMKPLRAKRAPRKPAQYWALVRTKTNQENYARRNAEKQGYTVILPRWQPKLRGRLEAYFPGYMFVLIEAGQGHSALRSTYGVIDALIGRVPIREIKRLRAMEDDEGIIRTPEQVAVILQALRNGRTLIKGETVKFTTGAYKDQSAVYKDVKPGGRIKLLFNFMGHDVAMEAERRDVAPVT